MASKWERQHHVLGYSSHSKQRDPERKIVTFGCGWFGKLGVPLGEYESDATDILGGSDGRDLPKVHQYSPKEVNVADVFAVALGGDHSVALGRGGTYVWGRCPLGAGKGLGPRKKSERFFRLGADCAGAEFVPEPIAIEPCLELEKISCGKQFAMGIDMVGRVHFWGLATTSRASRNLDGKPSLISDFPRIVPLRPKVEAREVACGWRHALLLDQNGMVYAFGDDDFGQCGIGAEAQVPEPRQVPGLDGDIVSISCGGVHSGAISAEGEAFLWGHGGNGRLGFGDTRHRWRPSKLPASSLVDVNQITSEEDLAPVVTAMAMGANFTVFVLGEDTLFASGNNNYGQIGCDPATNVDRMCPVPVAIPNECVGLPIVQVACGSYHTLCLFKGVGVVAWGQSVYGQCGVEAEDWVTPRMVRWESETADFEIVAVAAGDSHSALVLEDNLTTHHRHVPEFLSPPEVMKPRPNQLAPTQRRIKDTPNNALKHNRLPPTRVPKMEQLPDHISTWEEDEIIAQFCGSLRKKPKRKTSKEAYSPGDPSRWTLTSTAPLPIQSTPKSTGTLIVERHHHGPPVRSEGQVFPQGLRAMDKSYRRRNKAGGSNQFTETPRKQDSDKSWVSPAKSTPWRNQTIGKAMDELDMVMCKVSNHHANMDFLDGFETSDDSQRFSETLQIQQEDLVAEEQPEVSDLEPAKQESDLVPEYEEQKFEEDLTRVIGEHLPSDEIDDADYFPPSSPVATQSVFPENHVVIGGLQMPSSVPAARPWSREVSGDRPAPKPWSREPSDKATSKSGAFTDLPPVEICPPPKESTPIIQPTTPLYNSNNINDVLYNDSSGDEIGPINSFAIHEDSDPEDIPEVLPTSPKSNDGVAFAEQMRSVSPNLDFENSDDEEDTGTLVRGRQPLFSRQPRQAAASSSAVRPVLSNAMAPEESDQQESRVQQPFLEPETSPPRANNVSSSSSEAAPALANDVEHAPECAAPRDPERNFDADIGRPPSVPVANEIAAEPAPLQRITSIDELSDDSHIIEEPEQNQNRIQISTDEPEQQVPSGLDSRPEDSAVSPDQSVVPDASIDILDSVFPTHHVLPVRVEEPPAPVVEEVIIPKKTSVEEMKAKFEKMRGGKRTPSNVSFTSGVMANSMSSMGTARSASSGGVIPTNNSPIMQSPFASSAGMRPPALTVAEPVQQSLGNDPLFSNKSTPKSAQTILQPDSPSPPPREIKNTIPTGRYEGIWSANGLRFKLVLTIQEAFGQTITGTATFTSPEVAGKITQKLVESISATYNPSASLLKGEADRLDEGRCHWLSDYPPGFGSSAFESDLDDKSDDGVADLPDIIPEISVTKPEDEEVIRQSPASSSNQSPKSQSPQSPKNRFMSIGSAISSRIKSIITPKKERPSASREASPPVPIPEAGISIGQIDSHLTIGSVNNTSQATIKSVDAGASIKSLHSESSEQIAGGDHASPAPDDRPNPFVKAAPSGRPAPMMGDMRSHPSRSTLPNVSSFPGSFPSTEPERTTTDQPPEQQLTRGSNHSSFDSAVAPLRPEDIEMESPPGSPIPVVNVGEVPFIQGDSVVLNTRDDSIARMVSPERSPTPIHRIEKVEQQGRLLESMRLTSNWQATLRRRCRARNDAHRRRVLEMLRSRTSPSAWRQFMEALAVGSWASKVGSYSAGFGAAGAAAIPVTVTVPKYVFFGLIPWGTSAVTTSIAAALGTSVASVAMAASWIGMGVGVLTTPFILHGMNKAKTELERQQYETLFRAVLALRTKYRKQPSDQRKRRRAMRKFLKALYPNGKPKKKPQREVSRSVQFNMRRLSIGSRAASSRASNASPSRRSLREEVPLSPSLRSVSPMRLNKVRIYNFKRTPIGSDADTSSPMHHAASPSSRLLSPSKHVYSPTRSPKMMNIPPRITEEEHPSALEEIIPPDDINLDDVQPELPRPESAESVPSPLGAQNTRDQTVRFEDQEHSRLNSISSIEQPAKNTTRNSMSSAEVDAEGSGLDPPERRVSQEVELDDIARIQLEAQAYQEEVDQQGALKPPQENTEQQSILQRWFSADSDKFPSPEKSDPSKNGESPPPNPEIKTEFTEPGAEPTPASPNPNGFFSFFSRQQSSPMRTTNDPMTPHSGISRADTLKSLLKPQRSNQSLSVYSEGDFQTDLESYPDTDRKPSPPPVRLVKPVRRGRRWASAKRWRTQFDVTEQPERESSDNSSDWSDVSISEGSAADVDDLSPRPSKTDILKVPSKDADDAVTPGILSPKPERTQDSIDVTELPRGASEARPLEPISLHIPSDDPQGTVQPPVNLSLDSIMEDRREQQEEDQPSKEPSRDSSDSIPVSLRKADETVQVVQYNVNDSDDSSSSDGGDIPVLELNRCSLCYQLFKGRASAIVAKYATDMAVNVTSAGAFLPAASSPSAPFTRTQSGRTASSRVSGQCGN